MDTLLAQKNKISFYRTRNFWLVVFILQLVVSMVIFYSTFFNPSGEVMTNIAGLFYSLGATLFSLIGFSIDQTSGGWIARIIYLALICFLVYKTFVKQHVSLKYPLLVSVLFFINLLTVYIFISSLY